MEVADIIHNTDKPIRIVVIDSGIDRSIPELSQIVSLSTGFYINDIGHIIQEKGMQPRHEHATVIALIIKHICSSIELISINILNERLKTNGKVLTYAFEHALAYNPSIINLSLGTTRLRYKLPLWWLVKKAARQNAIVVAATERSGRICYPAYIKGVVGVKGDSDEQNTAIRYEEGFFYAPSHIGMIKGIEHFKEETERSGTSISAAYITGYIASILSNYHHTSNRETINSLKSILIKSRGVVI